MKYGLNYEQRHQLSLLLDQSYEDYYDSADMKNKDPLELFKQEEISSKKNPCEGLKQVIHKNISNSESRGINSTKTQLSSSRIVGIKRKRSDSQSEFYDIRISQASDGGHIEIG